MTKLHAELSASLSEVTKVHPSIHPHPHPQIKHTHTNTHHPQDKTKFCLVRQNTRQNFLWDSPRAPIEAPLRKTKRQNSGEKFYRVDVAEKIIISKAHTTPDSF